MLRFFILLFFSLCSLSFSTNSPSCQLKIMLEGLPNSQTINKKLVLKGRTKASIIDAIDKRDNKGSIASRIVERAQSENDNTILVKIGNESESFLADLALQMLLSELPQRRTTPQPYSTPSPSPLVEQRPIVTQEHPPSYSSTRSLGPGERIFAQILTFISATCTLMVGPYLRDADYDIVQQGIATGFFLFATGIFASVWIGDDPAVARAATTKPQPILSGRLNLLNNRIVDIENELRTYQLKLRAYQHELQGYQDLFLQLTSGLISESPTKEILERILSDQKFAGTEIGSFLKAVFLALHNDEGAAEDSLNEGEIYDFHFLPPRQPNKTALRGFDLLLFTPEQAETGGSESYLLLSPDPA